jgi:hypothetical protein
MMMEAKARADRLSNAGRKKPDEQDDTLIEVERKRRGGQQ